MHVYSSEGLEVIKLGIAEQLYKLTAHPAVQTWGVQPLSYPGILQCCSDHHGQPGVR